MKNDERFYKPTAVVAATTDKSNDSNSEQNSANILFDPLFFVVASFRVDTYWWSVLSGRWIAKINENKSYFDYG